MITFIIIPAVFSAIFVYAILKERNERREQEARENASDKGKGYFFTRAIKNYRN